MKTISAARSALKKPFQPTRMPEMLQSGFAVPDLVVYAEEQHQACKDDGAPAQVDIAEARSLVQRVELVGRQQHDQRVSQHLHAVVGQPAALAENQDGENIEDEDLSLLVGNELLLIGYKGERLIAFLAAQQTEHRDGKTEHGKHREEVAEFTPEPYDVGRGNRIVLSGERPVVVVGDLRSILHHVGYSAPGEELAGVRDLFRCHVDAGAAVCDGRCKGGVVDDGVRIEVSENRSGVAGGIDLDPGVKRHAVAGLEVFGRRDGRIQEHQVVVPLSAEECHVRLDEAVNLVARYGDFLLAECLGYAGDRVSDGHHALDAGVVVLLGFVIFCLEILELVLVQILFGELGSILADLLFLKRNAEFFVHEVDHGVVEGEEGAVMERCVAYAVAALGVSGDHDVGLVYEGQGAHIVDGVEHALGLDGDGGVGLALNRAGVSDVDVRVHQRCADLVLIVHGLFGEAGTVGTDVQHNKAAPGELRGIAAHGVLGAAAAVGENHAGKGAVRVGADRHVQVSVLYRASGVELHVRDADFSAV